MSLSHCDRKTLKGSSGSKLCFSGHWAAGSLMWSERTWSQSCSLWSWKFCGAEKVPWTWRWVARGVLFHSHNSFNVPLQKLIPVIWPHTEVFPKVKSETPFWQWKIIRRCILYNVLVFSKSYEAGKICCLLQTCIPALFGHLSVFMVDHFGLSLYSPHLESYDRYDLWGLRSESGHLCLISDRRGNVPSFS